MKLAFLGDALDHWKGSLFESLRDVGLITEFAVDPMASDFDAWTEKDVALYARLLRIHTSQVIRHTLGAHRQGYFAELRHPGDLFVDPDTGVATGPVKERERYITPQEIGELLSGGANRLVAIYQHVRARGVSARVDAVLATVHREVSKFGWSTYESGTVAMIFLSSRTDRTAPIAYHFREILHRHAETRIREGVRS